MQEAVYHETAGRRRPLECPSDDRFIREAERAKLTGVPRTTWWRAEKRDEVPKSYPLVGDTRGWLLSEIREWMRQRTAA